MLFVDKEYSMRETRRYEVYMIVIFFGLFSGCQTEDLSTIRSIEDLDQRSVFHFAVFSDNKGESPKSSVEFARMVSWVEAGWRQS